MPPLASLGDRLAAQFIDWAVAFAIVAVPEGLLLMIVGLRGGGMVAGGPVLLLFMLCALSYLLFSDSFPGGQSYGKRLMGLACIDANTGRPCSVWQSLVRNGLLHALGWIDWIFIFGSKCQRLGDKAANTIVIRVHTFHLSDHRVR
jgi:uncharacterized RDD family membrane protein YckC